jgi:Undecaprenyl-phosphate glucose phosphotransferase
MQDQLPHGARLSRAISEAWQGPAYAGGIVHRLGWGKGPAVAATVRAHPGARAAVTAAEEGPSVLRDASDAAFIIVLSNLAGLLYHWLAAKSPNMADFTYTGVLVAGTFVVAGRLQAASRGWEGQTNFNRLRDAVQSWTIAFAVLWFILFAFKVGSAVSRGSVLSFYLGCLPVIGFWRIATEPFISRIASRAGHGAREAIVICDGDDKAVDEFIGELIAIGYPPPTVVACARLTDPGMTASEQRHLLARTFEAARTCRQGEIFLCSGAIPQERLTSLERALSILPRAVYLVPEPQTASLVRCKPRAIGGYVAVEVQREPLGRSERLCKRAMDVALSSALLVLLAPSLLFIAIAIKLDSRGPVFFRQIRNGYRGQPFRIFKFRTMGVLEDGPEVRQARKGDERITRVGKYLRKTSLDELPQLLNVLLGDMSLVGPRPHAKAHDEFYSKAIENYEVRQHVKPGMTGWAQVNGLRGATQEIDLMYRRIEYDLWYALNASILFDCEILLRTVAEVFRQRNAY